MASEKTKNSQSISKDMEITIIPISKIIPNKSQPRKVFDRESLNELADNLKQNGLIQPIIIKKINGNYQIVAGERRWRASKIAGLKEIPCIIKEYKTEEKSITDALAENMHRTDLTLEEIGGYLKEIRKDKEEYTALAKRLGLNVKAVSDSLFYYDLPKEIKEEVGELSPHNALEIINTLGVDKTLKGKAAAERRLVPTKKAFVIKTLKKANREGWQRKKIREAMDALEIADEKVKDAFFDDRISTSQAKSITNIKNEKARNEALRSVIQSNTIAEATPELMKNATPELLEKVHQKFNSLQKSLFGNLNEAKVFLTKAVAKINTANKFLGQLSNQPIELSLNDKEVITTTQQLTNITEKIREFEVYAKEFEDNSLKITDK